MAPKITATTKMIVPITLRRDLLGRFGLGLLPNVDRCELSLWSDSPKLLSRTFSSADFGCGGGCFFMVVFAFTAREK